MSAKNLKRTPKKPIAPPSPNASAYVIFLDLAPNRAHAVWTLDRTLMTRHVTAYLRTAISWFTMSMRKARSIRPVYDVIGQPLAFCAKCCTNLFTSILTLASLVIANRCFLICRSTKGIRPLSVLTSAFHRLRLFYKLLLAAPDRRRPLSSKLSARFPRVLIKSNRNKPERAQFEHQPSKAQEPRNFSHLKLDWREYGWRKNFT